MCSGNIVGKSIPYDTEACIFGFPTEPVLVVTMMTPLAPFAPNTAVADASFSTDMVATSLGSMSEKLLSTPSTSTSGLEPFQLETPRMNMLTSLLPG